MTFHLERVRPLTADVFELSLTGDTSAITAPGQFVNIAVPGHFLRRPISVCDWTENRLTLLVRVVGDGTRELVESVPGAAFDVLSGLGNGFDLSDMPPPERVILVGGGIGVAPLYGLAKALTRRGATPVAALGFRSRDDVFYVDEFRALGCDVLTATEDGTSGVRGRVTDLLARRPGRTYAFCCGPSPMLRAVGTAAGLSGGQYSFEARMGCGFGACMGCSAPLRDGWKRVCKDGPVFRREEIAWET